MSEYNISDQLGEAIRELAEKTNGEIQVVLDDLLKIKEGQRKPMNNWEYLFQYENLTTAFIQILMMVRGTHRAIVIKRMTKKD